MADGIDKFGKIATAEYGKLAHVKPDPQRWQQAAVAALAILQSRMSAADADKAVFGSGVAHRHLPAETMDATTKRLIDRASPTGLHLEQTERRPRPASDPITLAIMGRGR